MHVGEWIRVVVHKYDHREHYAWDTVVRGMLPGLTVVGRPGPRELHHYSKDAIFTFQTDATEFFWDQLPFSIGISWSSERNELRWYCNIHQALWFEDNNIHFVDLDIDVVKQANEPFHLVDEDEFIEHAQLYDYPERYLNMVPAISAGLVDWLNTWPLGSETALTALCQQWSSDTAVTEQQLEAWLHVGNRIGQKLRL